MLMTQGGRTGLVTRGNNHRIRGQTFLSAPALTSGRGEGLEVVYESAVASNLINCACTPVGFLPGLQAPQAGAAPSFRGVVAGGAEGMQVGPAAPELSTLVASPGHTCRPLAASAVGAASRYHQMPLHGVAVFVWLLL